VDKITFTKEQLIKAFEIWNDDYLVNPGSYNEIKDCENPAELQAERLLEILENLGTKKVIVLTIPYKAKKENNEQ
jgi:hypothetical protein